jgi:hypothetical protein
VLLAYISLSRIFRPLKLLHPSANWTISVRVLAELACIRLFEL